MDIISVQDIRTSLGSIADRVQRGDSFLVMRNSKPAFRIVPVEEAGPTVREPREAYAATATPTIKDIQARFRSRPSARKLTEQDVEDALASVRHEKKYEKSSAREAGPATGPTSRRQHNQ